MPQYPQGVSRKALVGSQDCSEAREGVEEGASGVEIPRDWPKHLASWWKALGVQFLGDAAGEFSRPWLGGLLREW